MRGKKSIIKLTALVLSMLVLGGGNIVQAKQKENKLHEKTRQAIAEFPSLEKHLKKNTNGKLLKSTDHYFKLVPKAEVKDINLEESHNSNMAIVTPKLKKAADDANYAFVPVTEEEYNSVDVKGEKSSSDTGNDRGMQSLASSVIGPDGNQNSDYWMRLSLQVYQGVDASSFTAYNFWQWKTLPLFTMDDSAFITTDSALIVHSKNPDPMADYYADFYIAGTLWRTDIGSTSTAMGKHGVQGKHNLFTDDNYRNHRGVVACNFEFSNKSNHQTANFWGQYFHKEIGFGDVSIDAEGLPSISASAIVDESNTARVGVEYWP